MHETKKSMVDDIAMKKVQHAAGLACLAAVVVIWVTSSEVIQFIFDDIDFSKPFFLTFYSTSLFSLYLFGFLLFPSWRSNTKCECHYNLSSLLSIQSEITLNLV